jgi:nitrilase
MPLLRQSLYSQNVNLYLAPTADARDTWLPLMRTVALEGRCVVMTANQCITKSKLPTWITGSTEPGEVKTINGSASGSKRNSIQIEGGHEIAWHAKDLVADENAASTEGINYAGDHTPNGSQTSPSVTKDTKMNDENTAQAPAVSDEFVSRGGSCIISPLGDVLAGPSWEVENDLLFAEVDFDDCLRGRLDLDVGGSYSRCVATLLLRTRISALRLFSRLTGDNRNDSFHLTVDGLQLSPPP